MDITIGNQVYTLGKINESIYLVEHKRRETVLGKTAERLSLVRTFTIPASEIPEWFEKLTGMSQRGRT